MKWTLVTGGAKGLGAEICQILAERGFNIILQYDKSQQDAEKVRHLCRSKGVEAEIIQGNFSTSPNTEKFVNAFLERFLKAHILINNVGHFLNKSLLDTLPEEWQLLMQVNVIAPLTLSKALLPSIRESKGSIINIGVSGLFSMHSNMANTPYGMTKGLLWDVTKVLAREWASANVRINMVSPGILENSVDMPEDPLKLPMRRLGALHEVAHTVAFLLDENSHYITGQNIEVAGAVGL